MASKLKRPIKVEPQAPGSLEAAFERKREHLRTRVEDEPSMSVKELVKRLAYTEESVMLAGQDQATLFKLAADHRIAAYRVLQHAQNEFDRVQAATELAYRAEAVALGEKMTDSIAEAKVASNTKIVELQQKLSDAKTEDESMKLLLEAYRQRRDSLEVVAQWRGAAYRAQQAVEMGASELQNIRRNLAAKYGGED